MWCNRPTLRNFPFSTSPSKSSCDIEHCDNEEELSVNDVDDQLLSDSRLLERNQNYLWNQNWEVQNRVVGRLQVINVKKPTASLINYKCMHPNLYGNLSRISDLNQLAQLGGDWDWETRYNYSVFTPGTVLGLPPHLALAAFQKVSGKVQTCSNFGRLHARVENSSSYLCFGFRCRGRTGCPRGWGKRNKGSCWEDISEQRVWYSKPDRSLLQEQCRRNVTFHGGEDG